jgi:hypothetical protein
MGACPVDPPGGPARKSTPATKAIATKPMLTHRTAFQRRLIQTPPAGTGIPVHCPDLLFQSMRLDIHQGLHQGTPGVLMIVCSHSFHWLGNSWYSPKDPANRGDGNSPPHRSRIMSARYCVQTRKGSTVPEMRITTSPAYKRVFP